LGITHLAVKSKQILVLEGTNEGIKEDEMLKPLIEEANKRLKGKGRR
jgi:hypothetical protein